MFSCCPREEAFTRSYGIRKHKRKKEIKKTKVRSEFVGNNGREVSANKTE